MTSELGAKFAATIQQPRVRKGLNGQMAALAAARERHRGWKIALNNPAFQQAQRIDGPLIGHLLDDAMPSGASVALGPDRLLLVEAELALHITDTVPAGAATARWRDAIGGIAPALEFLAVPRERQSLEAVLEANSFSAGVVIGKVNPFAPAPVFDLQLTLQRNGEHVASLEPSLVVAPPADIVSFLAEAVAPWGETVQAGHLVLCGSPNPLVRLQISDHIAARISSVGDVTARVSARSA